MKCLLLLIIMLLVGCAQLNIPSAKLQTLAVDRAIDTNQYAYTTLDNGLQVLLIQSKQSTAALSIDFNVGSEHNPPRFLGLAHYLEHMLFLGNQQYPEPDEYFSFINQHGGLTNATTSGNNTNYYFTIDTKLLAPATKRLAALFQQPTFDPQYSRDEIGIIDAEFQRHTSSDGRVYYAARRQLLNPIHPASRFATGNTATLTQHGIPALNVALRKFFIDNYVANRAVVAVESSLPIAAMLAIVTDNFATLPQDITSKPTIATASRYAYVPSSMCIQARNLSWNVDWKFRIPPQKQFIDEKYIGYISYLLDDQASGSLAAELLSRNWVTYFSAGGFDNQFVASFIHVSMSLTPAGYANINHIEGMLYGYIQAMSRLTTHQQLYQQYAKIIQLHWQFSPMLAPLTQVRDAARLLHEYSYDQLYTTPLQFPQLNQVKLLRLLNALSAANTVRTTTVPECSATPATIHTEPLFGTNYTTNQAPVFAKAIPWTQQRTLNPFIPKNTSLIDATNDIHLVQNSPYLHWHATQTIHPIPKAAIYISLQNARYTDPKTQALLEIYINILQKQLQPDLYQAKVIGNHVVASSNFNGVTIRANGYSDTIVSTLELFIAKLLAKDINQAEFKNAQQQLMRELQNAKNARVSNRLSDQLNAHLQPQYTSYANRERSVATLKWSDWLAIRAGLVASDSITVLSIGNITPQQAKDAIEKMQLPYGPQQDISQPHINIIAQQQHIHSTLNPNETTNIAFIYLQTKQATPRTRLLTALAAAAQRDIFFKQLRTEENIGYAVRVSPYPVLNHPALSWSVESATLSGDAIQQRIATFMEWSKTYIAQLDTPTFNKIQQGLLTKLRKPERFLTQRTERFWDEIHRDDSDFLRNNTQIDILQQLTLADLQAFYADLLSGEIPQHSRIITAATAK